MEYLTLRAIYEVYIGNRTYQADRVKASFNNINYPANESDLAQRISEVPQQGIEALVSCSFCQFVQPHQRCDALSLHWWPPT